MKRPPRHQGHLDCFNHFPEPRQLQNGQLPHSNQDLWQISLHTGKGKRLAKKPPRKNLKRSKDLRLRQTKHLLVLPQVHIYFICFASYSLKIISFNLCPENIDIGNISFTTYLQGILCQNVLLFKPMPQSNYDISNSLILPAWSEFTS